jgi:hypothetical protein
MKRKKPLSTGAVVLIGFIGLIIVGAAGAILIHPDNNSDVARWFKVNYFPADEYGSTSIMDVAAGDVSSQEYEGSTSAAWVFSFIIAMVVLICAFVFFAKERRWL